jgi:prepilin-type N-terminal cleavage/methylation domain-containing protein
MFGLLGRKGFSLVEIAIVLVVIGLIISGGLLGLSPVLQANKLTQTNAQMDKIDKALQVYVIQNGCLPCPANPTDANSATKAGQAEITGGTTYTGCAGTTCINSNYGIVPWATLGLSENDVIDPYGGFIDYAPSTSTTGTASCPNTNAMNLTLSSTSLVRTPPSTYPCGTLSVDSAKTDGAMLGSSQTTAGAYLLISHGSDRSYAYLPPGGTGPASDPNSSAYQSCNSLAQTTCPTAGIYVQNPPQAKTTTPSDYFDDIVRFKTAAVIIQSCGSDACGNPQ